MDKIKKDNKGQIMKFFSILVCTLFYLKEEFIGYSPFKWKEDQPITIQMNEMYRKLEVRVDSIFIKYIQKKIQQQERIPMSLVEYYVYDICFLKSIGKCIIHVVQPMTHY